VPELHEQDPEASPAEEVEEQIVSIHDLADYARRYRLGIPEAVLRQVLLRLEEKHQRSLDDEAAERSGE